MFTSTHTYSDSIALIEGMPIFKSVNGLVHGHLELKV
jgi:hypothetical protein